MHLMHSVLGGTTQSIVAARLRGVVDPAALERAMARATAEFDILNARVEEQGDALRFSVGERRRTPPLRVKARTSDEDFEAAFEEENNLILDLNVDLWRVLLLTPEGAGDDRYDVILVAHHAIVDAHGVQMLLDALLRWTLDPSIPARQRALAPAAEEMMPQTVAWETFAEQQANIARSAPAFEPMKHVRPSTFEERQTRTLSFSLSAARLAELSEFARGARSTFNSLISAALLQAVKECSGERSVYSLGTAFSLRRLCDERLEDDSLGCYLSVAATQHMVDGKSLGELALEHATALPRAVLSYAKHPRSVPLGQFRESIARLRHIDGFIHDVAFTFAECELEEAYGPLRVDALYFSANRTLGSTSVVLHGVECSNGVHFTVNYTTPCQSDSWVGDVTQALVRRLTSVAA